MSKETGGPAFPGLNAQMTGIDSDGVERWETEPGGGITLRDYFAAKAVIGVVSCTGYATKSACKAAAECAYEIADAMLEARK